MSHSDAPNLPMELESLLARLRSRIRGYVLCEALALTAVVLGLVFWASLALDWGYFRLQRAELPRTVRFMVEVGALAATLAVAVLWGIARGLRAFHSRALALVLERRFPELNDRLITAVEMSGDAQRMPYMTRAMLERTVEELRDLVPKLDLGLVFDRRPLYRTGTSAIVLTVSVALFALFFGDLFQLWFRRNVLLANEVWKRETALRVAAVASPGERLIEFRQGVYKHPRGSDLTLQADILPSRKVPEQVQIRYHAVDSGASGRAYFTRHGTDTFKHTLTGVVSSFDFVLHAGDAERVPYHVVVVDPPRLDKVTLDCLYPEYTGRNTVDDESGKIVRTPQVVQGTQVTVPAGTDFLFQAETNKPLQGVRIQLAEYDLEITREQVRITLFGDQTQGTGGGEIVFRPTQSWLSSDGLRVQIPCIIAGKNEKLVASQIRAADPGPLPFPAEALLKVTLHDTDDIVSQEPQRVLIRAIADEPPVIETRRKGIGTAITRKAVIPLTGSVTDDYGVAEVRYDYRLDDQMEWDSRELPPVPPGLTELKLENSPDDPVIRFDVLPLELKVGQKLFLGLWARDSDTLHGPHVTTGERYAFEIVSEEDLLSQLYARELNLRLRFEQILSELKRTQTELTTTEPRLTEYAALAGKGGTDVDEQRRQLDSTILTAAERGLYGIRKNHNELQAIEQSLGDIREEMVNNGVDTPQSLERIDQKLIRPLREVNENDFPAVDQQLGLFKLAWQDQKNPQERLAETLPPLDRLIRRLEQVLVEMRKLETYKELLEKLKVIRGLQEDLQKKTETENKRSLIEKLK